MLKRVPEIASMSFSSLSVFLLGYAVFIHRFVR